ncbi:PilN domain-containing protein [Diaphorobacter sp. HDW4B]|uniref:PilN domain-containing protein n=1 Tax=Diaphorobacter sp. HDW4B TaxID=2714925 RepID=UPI001407C69D|nr:PilN domain-containing protein [Diaphorobacter sp. HDW4B]QIL70228.1 PilN domain-containing protein [Diaphorobacter sp. HDW4B]
MPIASDELKLFGLDLRTLWAEVRSPWRKLARAPGWSWLAPRTVISLKMADGTASEWVPDDAIHGFRKIDTAALAADDNKQSAFEAIMLPDDLLLRKKLFMPRIDGDQIKQALALEAMNSTPFSAGDLVWGYATYPTEAKEDDSLMEVELTLASRRRVEQFLGTREGLGGEPQSAEVWAGLSRRNDRALLMTGFGEEKRERATRRHWQVLAGLAGTVVVLCVAMAVTPYLQLRARVLQANLAYAALDKSAAPAIAKREALLKADDQVKALADIIGHRLDPLQVIQMLTTTLPDDTMLNRLQITDRKVLIVGQASDASALMQKLGSKSEIREVKAPSAAVRQPGMTKEAFQIEFQLTDDFGVSEANAQTAAALKGDSVTTAEATAPASAASGAATAASGPVVAASLPAGAASAPQSAATSAATAASAAKAPVPAASAPGAQKPKTTGTPTIGGAR